MKGSSLALLLAPKKGEEADADDEGDAEESESDYTELAEAAFPDEDWTPERLKAFKELVMSCVGS